MSSTTSAEFDNVRKQFEETIAARIKEVLTTAVLADLLTPDDGLQLLSESAFSIDRKAIVAKVLREIANDVESGYRISKR